MLIVVRVPHCGFNSLVFQWHGMFPTCSFGTHHLFLFFGERSFKDFCTFILGFFVFLLLHLDKFFIYSGFTSVFSSPVDYLLFFSLWPHHVACGILVPWPGFALKLQAVKACSATLDHQGIPSPVDYLLTLLTGSFQEKFFILMKYDFSSFT